MGSDHNLYRTIGMGCMVYSYGDAMKRSHKHYVEMDCPFEQTYCRKHGLTSEGCGICESYVRGINAPNYLPPAIAHAVIIKPDYVAVYGKRHVSFAAFYKK